MMGKPKEAPMGLEAAKLANAKMTALENQVEKVFMDTMNAHQGTVSDAIGQGYRAANEKARLMSTKNNQRTQLIMLENFAFGLYNRWKRLITFTPRELTQ